MLKASTPCLATIQRKVGLEELRALIVYALCELCEFFNVGKNMNDTQVKITTELIIENFPDFKAEEIKYCFRKAMSHGKVYDRLDGNIIIGWLNDYRIERSQEAIRLSEKEEEERRAALRERSPEATTLEAALAHYESLAEEGDREAQKSVDCIKAWLSGSVFRAFPE